MKQHTKIYLKFFGLSNDPTAFLPCEVCGAKAVDIHHIREKGMGGNPSGDRDNIANLIALCREDHEAAHAHKWTDEELEQTHRDFCQKEGRALK